MNQLSYKKGNLFTSSAQTIVNTVNCVGIMGAGIALEFKYRYPEMYKKYVELCKNNQIQTGRLWLYNKDINRKWVLNFPTKKDWKHPSKLEYLESGLEKFLKFYKERNITSIAFPLLGAQNGGIDPEQSLTTMKNYLSKCDIPVEIYEYTPDAKDDLIDSFIKHITDGDIESIVNQYGIRGSDLKKIKDYITSNSINSLIQIKQIPGVGKETIEKCFSFALNLNLKAMSEVDSRTENSDGYLFPLDSIVKKELNKKNKKRRLTKSSR
jgi:O-acetyl-ADP-ribose deacetylase (regulator of RNase III)